MTSSAVPDSVVVLCGGRGLRAWPLTAEVPKALLPVGDRPVLDHLVQVFHAQGVHRVVLAAGYLVETVQQWAAATEHRDAVTVLDTGADSGTAERVRRCADEVGDRFFVTYGDGLGNVDLRALAAAHARAQATVTLTTVPLPSPYGTVTLGPDDQVTGFVEKPRLPDHWINAGFFVVEREALDSWAGPDLERDVLPALAAQGRLHAYRHDGFWKSMDTQKDLADMHALATEGGSPWLDLPAPASS